jgi:hypothetical protein
VRTNDRAHHGRPLSHLERSSPHAAIVMFEIGMAGVTKVTVL